MLEDAFNDIYTKFKLNFYKGIFERLKGRQSNLTAAEAYAAEVIFALKNPRISQFAEFLHVSLPNATYKVNTLVRKGYVEKTASDTDKRETRLSVTQKFMDYYAINKNYVKTVTERIKERFAENDVKWLEDMLRTISRELMPECGEGL